MNDRQNPYDPYQQPQIIGYDEYGQPVYQQQGQQQGQQHYDPYAQQQQQQQPQQDQQSGHPQQGYGYGYDAYGQPVYQQQGQQHYDPYAQQQAQPQQQVHPSQPPQAQPPQQGYGYGDGYGAYGYDTGRQPAVDDSTQQWAATPAPAAAPPPPPSSPAPEPERQREPEPAAEAAVPGQRRAEGEPGTEQFAFIEEPDEESEDVIDWLKFTESRSERREEARRRGHNRMIALIVVAALVVVGGAGYLWFAGKIPGVSGGGEQNTTATGPQKRDVIVVHLHNTKKGGTSTALLVDNVTTGQGTTVLLPNSLAVAGEDGATTTLGTSVDDDGSTGTREAIDTLLGTSISGTWRLDTPYLENLVELVGNIEVDTDTAVPDAKKGAAPLVEQGEGQTLSGPMAVAYATYRGADEPEAKQLMRFGQVMRSVLRKLSEDPKAATVTIETLAQILDPSLPEQDLGASLAKLAGHAKVGDYKTELLPVQSDGTLTESAVASVVKDVLGGKVKAPEQGAAVRVGIKNATGNTKGTERARVQLVNGGYAFVDSGTAGAATSSEVVYGAAEDKAKAVEVAKTLGLPESSVGKGEPAANADVSVVLGQDYEIPGQTS
ncbi:LCP family protein [Streptomyces sp. NPDC006296]|uniref:LCP family protein n=1 Tax=Streptomyces sp. NPDC006296 TaxID=3156746 RepID=UPI0033A05E00